MFFILELIILFLWFKSYTNMKEINSLPICSSVFVLFFSYHAEWIEIHVQRFLVRDINIIILILWIQFNAIQKKK